MIVTGETKALKDEGSVDAVEIKREMKSEETTTSSQKAGESSTATTVRRKVGRPRKSAKVSLTTRKRPYPTRSATKSRSSDDPSNPVALLDMLAEVASATLENDRLVKKRRRRGRKVGGGGRKSLRQPISQRGVGSTGGATPPTAVISRNTQKKTGGLGDPAPDQSLNLDQIRILPDKTLLQYFSELTADEIRRNYSYVCYLVPDKCNQKYTSFGNDNRARMQMKSHLLSHIAELLADATSHGRSSQKNRFTAEPVSVRKRRLMTTEQGEGVGPPKRRADFGKPADSTRRVPRGASKSLQTKKWKLAAKLKRKLPAIRKPDKGLKKATKQGKTDKSKSSAATVEAKPKRGAYRKVLLEEVLEEEVMDEEVFYGNVIYDEGNHDGGDGGAVEEPIEGGVVITVVQPLHDHSYTFTNRKKNGLNRNVGEGDDFDVGEDDDDDEGDYHDDADNCDERMNGDDDDDDNRAIMSSSVSVVPTSEPETQVEPSEADQPTKTRTKQAEMALRQLEAIRLLQIQKNKKLALTSTAYSSLVEIADAPSVIRIDVPRSTPLEIEGAMEVEEAEADAEEEEGDEEAEEYDVTDEKEISLATDSIATATTVVTAYDSDAEKAETSSDVGSPEWERKLALKYIRMLRLKKKDEHVPLVCRICEGQKCFTAQATLMYHYRSHAGIKPFVCGICQTTFTRQHSLNYHMLIHNNKSRFTCGDCGRQFRHPSHFKEHLRRHTGETPFECTDCGVRFKTRNTYKRHLKTRHGKLLTVNGIVTLSTEEFMKVKTNPKRKAMRLSKRDGGGGETQYLEDEEDSIDLDATTSQDEIDRREEEEEEEEDDEDAIAVKSLEQQPDIVQAAVEAIIQDEVLEQQEEEEEGVEDDPDGEDGGTLYTFYSIGVGRDPLNGKEIIVLEAVPQSSVRHQQSSAAATAESTSSLQQPIVQCT